MSDKEFYVRWRGRVSGPFAVEELRERMDRGQLSQLHEISRDGEDWSQVRDVDELSVSDSPDESENNEPYSRFRTEPAPGDVRSAAATAEWYYSRDAYVDGPCTADRVIRVLQEAKDPGRFRVSHISEPSEWKQLDEVEEFREVMERSEPAEGGHEASAPAAGARKAKASMILSLLGVVIPFCGFLGLIWGLQVRTSAEVNDGSASSRKAGTAVAISVFDVMLDMGRIGLLLYLLVTRL
jgi:hypothetical protein